MAVGGATAEHIGYAGSEATAGAAEIAAGAAGVG